MADVQQCEWGGVPEPRASGEMVRRVEILIEIILVRIVHGKGRREAAPPEAGAERPPSGLTRRQVRHWLIKEMGCDQRMLQETWIKDTQLGEASD